MTNPEQYHDPKDPKNVELTNKKPMYSGSGKLEMADILYSILNGGNVIIDEGNVVPANVMNDITDRLHSQVGGKAESPSQDAELRAVDRSNSVPGEKYAGRTQLPRSVLQSMFGWKYEDFRDPARGVREPDQPYKPTEDKPE